MKWLLMLVLVAALACSSALAEVTVIRDARIYTMADGGQAETERTIVIRDGRIAAIGVDPEVPAGARLIEAAGRIVTPGLISAASQLGLTEFSNNDHSNDQQVSDGTLGPGFDIQYALNANSLLLQQARADGLTRAVSLPGVSNNAPFHGLGALLHLHEGPDILERAGLTVMATVGGPSAGAAGGSRAAQWMLLRNALDQARFWSPPEKKKMKALSLEDLNSRALNSVIEGDIPLLLDVRRESDIRQALKLNQDYGLHLILIGATEAWRVADKLAAANIPVILDAAADLPLSIDERGARADAASILHRAGVLIAFYPSGSLHYSLNAGLGARESAGLAVANGLPYEAGLRALTVNPAKIWGIDDHAGILVEGWDADLVIWDGDPLEPASAPEIVMVEGREVSLITRQTLLRDRYLRSATD
jgi:imidazolonepropionase-like amidohydrolase